MQSPVVLESIKTRTKMRLFKSSPSTLLIHVSVLHSDVPPLSTSPYTTELKHSDMFLLFQRHHTHNRWGSPPAMMSHQLIKSWRPWCVYVLGQVPCSTALSTLPSITGTFSSHFSSIFPDSLFSQSHLLHFHYIWLT